MLHRCMIATVSINHKSDVNNCWFSWSVIINWIFWLAKSTHLNMLMRVLGYSKWIFYFSNFRKHHKQFIHQQSCQQKDGWRKPQFEAGIVCLCRVWRRSTTAATCSKNWPTPNCSRPTLCWPRPRRNTRERKNTWVWA